MKSNQLKEVALHQFALHGYQGASLATIANEVGIKKQSIYAHFKSKEDLFMSTFTDSLENELYFVKQFMEKNHSLSLKEILYNFLNDYLGRYQKDHHMSFFMRTSFFPPLQFEEQIKNGTNTFVNELESLFLGMFEDKKDDLNPNIAPESAMMSFLTIFDGLLVELLYGFPERLQKRLTSSWDIYWQGITK
ncbi:MULTISPECIES: TetR/AcrR family transcriptional regulator [Bacillaceae]|uniref:TetR/AcrR family transcriptional regulator n=1 Tax=Bacillaceae TaxID=186817 RepID=UPI0010432781|nr:TetR/AcrR family transcriptional regulator [Bacillus sp. CBEL-1]TDB50378.1 TetR/AcrR family transcriptional regulator [Bacillus sp. CBEL-1]